MTATVATIVEIRAKVASARGRGRTIGLVPTMGALHEGHLSLVRAARAETGFVAVSIFVNPTQFGPNEDLAAYPRPLGHDLEVCTREGVDLVFAPSERELYPEGFRTFIEVTELQDVLCGAARPGHFRGVATIVLKLFQIVQPDRAYFGRKDAQQLRIIQQLVRDLNVPVEIRPCPTVRAADGLALSSRNQYLDPDRRRQATILWHALQDAERLVAAGERDAGAVRKALRDRIATAPDAVIDYAEVVNGDTLRPVERMQGPVLIALAVKLGGTRLIDNIEVNLS